MSMPIVLTIETSSLGDRSYLLHDGQVAAVIDPQRDIDRVLTLAQDQGIQITHVLETHIHNDYVTGGRALAREVGASYHVNAADDVSFERTPITDGDVVEVSEAITLRALHTPGHTFTHLSYALEGERPVVFTGGSLLFGATGRPDLLGAEHTDELARLQHASVRRLVQELPEATEVMPTHGFGSFCAATQSEADASTLGQERGANPALSQDEQTYVDSIVDGLDLYPAYYAHMGPANAAGPDAADLRLPGEADAQEVRRRLEAGEWVVDLRTRTAFAAGHAPGTYNLGLDGQLATWLGWMIPWGTTVTLLGESVEQVAEAQRELARIGVDEVAARATGEPEQWSDRPLASLEVALFADLAQVRHHRRAQVLDVRNPKEYAASHIEGAAHIPLGQLTERVSEVPDGEVWVHCATGYRSSIAASVLAAHDRRVVLIDDTFADQAADSGLSMAHES